MAPFQNTIHDVLTHFFPTGNHLPKKTARKNMLFFGGIIGFASMIMPSVLANVSISTSLENNVMTIEKLRVTVDGGVTSARKVELDKDGVRLNLGAPQGVLKRNTDGYIIQGSVNGSDIGTDAIGSNHIAAGAITSNHIATGAITTNHIATGAIGCAHLNIPGFDCNGGTTAPNGTCPNGQYLQGITSTGAYICNTLGGGTATLPSCVQNQILVFSGGSNSWECKQMPSEITPDSSLWMHAQGLLYNRIYNKNFDGGLVGIGLTNPQETLHVKGTFLVEKDPNAVGGGAISCGTPSPMPKECKDLDALTKERAFRESLCSDGAREVPENTLGCGPKEEKGPEIMTRQCLDGGKGVIDCSQTLEAAEPAAELTGSCDVVYAYKEDTDISNIKYTTANAQVQSEIGTNMQPCICERFMEANGARTNSCSQEAGVAGHSMDVNYSSLAWTPSNAKRVKKNYVGSYCYVARHITGGNINTNFNPNANGLVRALVVQSDNKIVVGGDFSTISGAAVYRLGRLNSDGSRDTTFANPNLNGATNSLAVQTDGKIIIGGAFTTAGSPSTARNRIARINTNGTLDTTFNPGTAFNSAVNAVAIQGDGKVLVGGSFTTFSGTTRNYIARLNTDGSLDTAFNPNAVGGAVNVIVVQSDGKILVGGGFTTIAGTTRNRIARLNADGTIDTTFNPNANSTIMTIALSPLDNTIIVGGFFTNIAGSAKNRVVKLNATNGALISSFNPDLNDYPVSILVQPDGNVVIGGMFTNVNSSTANPIIKNYIVRYYSDGTLDTTFNTNANGYVYALGFQTDVINTYVTIGGGFTSLRSPAPSAANSALSMINRIGRVFAYNDISTGRELWQHVSAILPQNCAGEFACVYDGNIQETDELASEDTNAIFYVNSKGVGIKTRDPGFELDVVGTIRANTVLTLSDARLKTDTHVIENALQKLLGINGYIYTLKANQSTQYGLLAQQVEEFFPYAVTTDANGRKAVNYNSMIAPLIQAIHELDTKIEKVDSIYQKNEARIKALEEKIK